MPENAGTSKRCASIRPKHLKYTAVHICINIESKAQEKTDELRGQVTWEGDMNAFRTGG